MELTLTGRAAFLPFENGEITGFQHVFFGPTPEEAAEGRRMSFPCEQMDPPPGTAIEGVNDPWIAIVVQGRAGKWAARRRYLEGGRPQGAEAEITD